MGIQINTNVSSSLIQRSLTSANKEIEQSMVKIAYGRINKAVEDAAGLSISESLKAQARGSEVAYSNAQSGINLLETAESGLGSISENLQRVRELTMQAANGTYGEAERNAIKSEIQSLVSEIDRVAESTSFNDIKLLNGSNNNTSLQIGANAENATNSLKIGDALGSAKAETLGMPVGANLDNALSSSTNAAQLLDNIDGALSSINERRSNIGSMQNRLESTVNSLQIKQENMSAAESRIRDVDVAKETSKLTQNQILQNSSALLLAQANQNPAMATILI
ncbi:MAG: hypothetical protein A2287_05730 [Candidatus Melainabacteria bacterium RIFOXYA12_FULL_32_12]|nr:MAG: hypothetical protein A2255_07370 [Candidatus Melainabacteria bacterium RIFOXYA2_FULL_32_9]OGI30747.1 MAG: hypothetical protein A2287_05730 [Candidatus Melainabacteria bacterium RIFOXYA12_FULL_32_12]